MYIAPQIHHFAPELSPQQLEVVGHTGGPLRVVAGPGAGKNSHSHLAFPESSWFKGSAVRRNCSCWRSASRLLRR